MSFYEERPLTVQQHHLSALITAVNDCRRADTMAQALPSRHKHVGRNYTKMRRLRNPLSVLAAAMAVLILASFYTESRMWRNLQQQGEGSSIQHQYYYDDDGDTHDENPSKIAIVIRTMMPMKRSVLERIVELSRALSRSPTFDQYDLVVLSDETKVNGTADTLQAFFEHYAPDAPMPRVFRITGPKLLKYFGEGLTGYLDGRWFDQEDEEQEVNNGTIDVEGKSEIMWQFLTPPVVIFHTLNPQYQYAWAIEDDVWAISHDHYLAPVVDLLRYWDGRMVEIFESEVGFAGIAMNASNCPFQEWDGWLRHTAPFEKVIERMQNTSDQEQWMKKDGRPHWSHVVHYNRSQLPSRWTCTSDALFRHSLSYSQHLLKAIRDEHVFSFAESFHQPMAWDGGFEIADLELLFPPNERPPIGFEKLSGDGVKITIEKAKAIFQDYDNPYFLFHQEMPPRKWRIEKLTQQSRIRQRRWK